MTELDEKAIDALIEAGSNSDPFTRPVQYMASKLGLTIDEARTLTGRLLSERLIHTVIAEPANNIVQKWRIVLVRYVWERVSDT